MKDLKNLKEGRTILLVSIQDLRSIQERCEIGELVQRLDVSIDRLTVIWDTDTGSLRRIFKNLKQAISTRVDSFEIHDNVRDDVFTLAKDFNEYDSINIIFFQLSKLSYINPIIQIIPIYFFLLINKSIKKFLEIIILVLTNY